MARAHIGAEHFFNERLGSYDPLNNRITSADIGTIFPDGSMRLVWREEPFKLFFDDAVDLARRSVEFLLELQELRQFKQTEQEYEDNVLEDMVERRVKALFGAGFWPCEDGSFEPLPATDVAQLLTRLQLESDALAVPA